MMLLGTTVDTAQVLSNCIGACFGFLLAIIGEGIFTAIRKKWAKHILKRSLDKELKEIADTITPLVESISNYPYYVRYACPVWDAACSSGMIHSLLKWKDYQYYGKAYGNIVFANKKEEEYNRLDLESLSLSLKENRINEIVAVFDTERKSMAKQILSAINPRS